MVPVGIENVFGEISGRDGGRPVQGQDHAAGMSLTSFLSGP